MKLTKIYNNFVTPIKYSDCLTIYTIPTIFLKNKQFKIDMNLKSSSLKPYLKKQTLISTININLVKYFKNEGTSKDE